MTPIAAIKQYVFFSRGISAQSLLLFDESEYRIRRENILTPLNNL